MVVMCDFRVYVYIFLVCCVSLVNSNIPDYQQCADPECSKKISEAKTQIHYFGLFDGALSFKRGDKLYIYGKSTPEDVKLNKNSYWEAELNGERGYVSPGMIKETRVYERDLITVPTKKKEHKEILQPSQEEVHTHNFPGGVAAELGDGEPAHTPSTVIEGTTIFLGTDGEKIAATNSEEVPMKTEVPVETTIADDDMGTDNETEESTEKLSSDIMDLSDEDDDDIDEEDEGEDEDDVEEDEKEESEMEQSNENIDIKKLLDDGINSGPGQSPELDAILLTKRHKKSVESADFNKIDNSDSSISNKESEMSSAPSPPSLPSSESDLQVTESSLVTETIPYPAASVPQPSVSQSLPSATTPPSTLISDTTESLLQSSYSENSIQNETASPNIVPFKSTESITEPPSEDPIKVEMPSTQTILQDIVENAPATEPSNLFSVNSDTATEIPPSNAPPSPDSTEPPSLTTEQNLGPSISSSNHIPVEMTTETSPALESASVSPPGEDSLQVEASSPKSILQDIVEGPPDAAYPTNEPFSQRSDITTDVPLRSVLYSSDSVEQSPLSSSDSTPPPSYSSEHASSTPSNSEGAHKPHATFQNYGSLPPFIASHATLPSVKDDISDKSTPSDVPNLHEQQKPEMSNNGKETNQKTTNNDKLTEEAESMPNPQQLWPNNKSPESSDNLIQDPTATDTTATDASENEPASKGILGLGGVFSNLLVSEKPFEEIKDIVPEKAETFSNNVASDLLFKENLPTVVAPDGECKSVEGLESDCGDAPSPSQFFEFFDRKATGSGYTFLYLIITAVTVLIFTLGYYFIERNRQNGPLIAKVNQLTRELQVATSQIESRAFKESNSLAEINNEVLIALQAEVDDLRRIKSEQEAQLESQQQELDSATEAGLELNRMLSDLLTQKHGSDNLLQSVEQLQGQLNSQQQVIDDMNRSLLEKSAENEGLQAELLTTQETVDSLEQELNDMKQNLNMHLKEKEEVTQELTEHNKTLQIELNAAVKSKNNEVSALTQQLQEVTEKLAYRDSEFAALNETIEELKKLGQVDPSSLYDVGHVKADLLRVTVERDALQERLHDEEGARKLLENHVKAVDTEVANLRASSELAEKEKIEAETRLTVLSNYFKEKETQLQKELGLQEAIMVQKQGDESTVFERLKALQEEVDNYKSQNETLKKEILDQERGLKGQIATLEKKAHENWVAARQAERRLEESKQEAGQLRNMLTLIEKSQVTESDSKPAGRDLNGDEPLPPILSDGASPLPFPPPLPLDPLGPPPPMLPPGFMPPPFMHPPPSGFMPPPPFLPGDRRPAPLGRMSSPPLNSRFSPGPGDYDDYDRISPAPLSPPVRNYRSPAEADRFRHRTPPSPSFSGRPWEEGQRASFRPVASQRDSRRDYQGSNISSGHSSNESLDKASRSKV